jgi:hypothetical protein
VQLSATVKDATGGKGGGQTQLSKVQIHAEQGPGRKMQNTRLGGKCSTGGCEEKAVQGPGRKTQNGGLEENAEQDAERKMQN